MSFDPANDGYASEAFHGYGSALFVGDGASPENFVAVAEVLTIAPGAMTTAAIDRTHLRSPQAHREKIPGIRDTGPFTITGNWRPQNVTQSNDAGEGSPGGSPVDQPGGLVYLARTRAVRNFKIVLSDGLAGVGSPSTTDTEWPFRGFVSSFHPGEIGIDNVVKFTAEITPTQDISADLP
jgi:hypothetical protein